MDPSRGCRGYEQNLQQNWNGNVIFGGIPIIPSSVDEICKIVRTATPPIKVVGRGHSFTNLTECKGGTILSLMKLNRILDFTPPSSNSIMGSITVQGGTTFTEIATFLGTKGALPNMPSCSQFTVAGAIATGTHGSGITQPNLSSHVSMLEFVIADGSIVRYDTRSKNDVNNILQGCRIHLGCVGIITSLKLDVVPYYEVESVRYETVPLTNAITELPKLWQLCDSLSIWTAGFGQGHGKGQCWITFRHFVSPSNKESQHKSQVASSLSTLQSVLGATGRLVTHSVERYCCDPLTPIPFTPTGRGPWCEQLTLTMYQGQETSMSVVDLQAEFFVPIQHAQDAIYAVWNVAKDWTFSSPPAAVAPTSTISGQQKYKFKGLVDAMEFRQVKGGDGAWMSPHPIDSLGIHISFNGDVAFRSQVYNECVPALEKALKPFGVRCHWGKLASHLYTPQSIQETYAEGLIKFRKLCLRHDPTGKFRNDFLSYTLGFDNDMSQKLKASL